MGQLPRLGRWRFLVVFLHPEWVVPPDLPCSESALDATDCGVLGTVNPPSLVVFRLA